MGVINANNILNFKSAQSLYDRVKSTLKSYDAQGLIDDDTFAKHVVYVLGLLGQAVHTECEAIVPICDRVGILPRNIKTLYAIYKCRHSSGTVPSINEQKPIIYYQDTEIEQICKPNCKACCENDYGKQKIVIRTFVNGEDCVNEYCDPVLLTLSSNVSFPCEKDSPCTIRSRGNEVTIKDGKIATHFKEGHILLQYYGLPFDNEGLPLIPDDEIYEKAIYYYLITQLFEEFYFNTSIPGIANFLQTANFKYDEALQTARYQAKLPSFARMVESTKRQRNRNKFYFSIGDRTIVSQSGVFRRPYGRNY